MPGASIAGASSRSIGKRLGLKPQEIKIGAGAMREFIRRALVNDTARIHHGDTVEVLKR
jgi:hypothetical protein